MIDPWGRQSCLQAAFQAAVAGWKASLQPGLAAPLPYEPQFH